MYLTRWTLDEDQQIKARMSDEYRIHQAVYLLFGDSDGRDFLYCTEREGCDMRIIIQSERLPGEPKEGSVEVIEVPDGYLDGNAYLFRVKFSCGIQSEKFIPLKKEEEVLPWLISRASRWGISFMTESMHKTGDGVMNFRQKKNEHSVVITYTEVTGLLRVKDRSLFTDMVTKGIGRSRGFGMGLVQLYQIKEV